MNMKKRTLSLLLALLLIISTAALGESAAETADVPTINGYTLPESLTIPCDGLTFCLPEGAEISDPITSDGNFMSAAYVTSESTFWALMVTGTSLKARGANKQNAQSKILWDVEEVYTVPNCPEVAYGYSDRGLHAMYLSADGEIACDISIYLPNEAATQDEVQALLPLLEAVLLSAHTDGAQAASGAQTADTATTTYNLFIDALENPNAEQTDWKTVSITGAGYSLSLSPDVIQPTQSAFSAPPLYATFMSSNAYVTDENKIQLEGIAGAYGIAISREEDMMKQYKTPPKDS